ncbi:glutathione S-transferase family protein [Luteimonas terrae]|uniref:Glutathione S-transferase n=1 Tax=Luteimonas terrae TaxID=1530191 RepID=A0ABU1XW88_9GAMM|nr:glutathione S-transferase family protein [Luteimonas terrae]MDR7192868.1 glutathione S-transferase [Luteimonas terrae]
MTTVYGYSPSGNCHKVRLLLEQLGRPYTWIETDSSRGETRTRAYLAKNPNGQVPMLELDDGRVLVESNAILCFLAAGTSLLPTDPWQHAHAQALRWMFFEQYSHEPAIAVARFIRGWTDAGSPRRSELSALQARGHRALKVMDGHLAGGATWFSGDVYGVADIALFAYTAVAPDGGFDLTRYPALRDWLARVRGTPGFIDMPAPAPVNAARLAATD